ncbi:uncharacterized protein [Antedon mediterranea]|uniref:uncharacterized protein n=1 Tax=Antedon mediterranea TaxID=105859 RepID=UPI003AF93B9E
MYVIDTIFTDEDLHTKTNHEGILSKNYFVCRKCRNEITFSDEDIIEFNLYDTDSVTIPAIKCKTQDCPIGLLKIRGIWLTIDALLTSGKAKPTGFEKVTSVGEKVILSVLNNIRYKEFDRQPTDPEFLPHSFDEYAKLLWINNTAVGFYTVKKKGTWCGSQSQALAWQLSVLDTVYVSSNHRRQGYGLLVIRDFLNTFPDEDLGISEPVSESMLLVCKRFVKDDPKEAERLWLCTLPADNSHSENLVLRLAFSGMASKTKKRKNSEPKRIVSDAAIAGNQSESDDFEIEQDCSDDVADKSAITSSSNIDIYTNSHSNVLRNFSVIAKASMDEKKAKQTVRKVSTPILPMQSLLQMPENDNQPIDETDYPDILKNDELNEPEINDNNNALEVDAIQDTISEENFEDTLNCFPELNMENNCNQDKNSDTERSQSPTGFAPVADKSQYYVKSEPINEEDCPQLQNQHSLSKKRNMLEEEPSSSCSVVIKQEPTSDDDQTLQLNVNQPYLFTMQQSKFKSDLSDDEINDQELDLEDPVDTELNENNKNKRKLSLFEHMLLPSGQDQGSSGEGTSILQNLNQSQGMISSLLRNIAEQLKEPRTTAVNHEPIWQTRATQETCDAQSSLDSQKRLHKTTYPITKLASHLVKKKHKMKARDSDKNFNYKRKDLRNIYVEGPSRRTRSHSSTDNVTNQIPAWNRPDDDEEEIVDSSSSSSTNRRKASKTVKTFVCNYRDNSHQFSSKPVTSGVCSTTHSSTTISSIPTKKDFQAERPERPKRPFNIVQAMTVSCPSSTESTFPQGTLFDSTIGLVDTHQSLSRLNRGRPHAPSHSASTSSTVHSDSHEAQSVMASGSNLVDSRSDAQNPLIRGLLEMRAPLKRTLMQMKQENTKKSKLVLESASTSQDVETSENSRLNINSMSTQTGNYVCEPCDIIFTDSVMYVLHTGCHGRQHAYECNQCGTICRDKYEFMIHFVQGIHNRE